MGLFGTHKVSKGLADEAVAMVETYYHHRGLDVHDHQLSGSEGHGWWLTEGSAKIYIFVQDGPNGAVLRITSPLVYVPTQNKEAFFHRLLDINTNLTSCALATHGEIVLVVCQRPTVGLSQSELEELVWNAAYVADLLDNKLAEEFNARMYSEDGESSQRASKTR
jgi:Putative bacterial sensory transduction regulator